MVAGCRKGIGDHGLGCKVGVAAHVASGVAASGASCELVGSIRQITADMWLPKALCKQYPYIFLSFYFPGQIV